MKNKIVSIFAILIVGIFLFGFVSSTELKLVKVSELKQGDVMVDKSGNEIVIKNITAQPQSTKTIGDVIKEKLSRSSNTNNAVVENSIKIAEKEILLGAGSKKVGLIDAFAVYNNPSTTQQSKSALVFAMTIQKVKSIISFGKWQ